MPCARRTGSRRDAPASPAVPRQKIVFRTLQARSSFLRRGINDALTRPLASPRPPPGSSLPRKLALQYHPDKNPNDADAEKKFKEVVSAYECLTREDGGEDGGLEDEIFESPEDMRDFAASFFESFFFGGSGGFAGFRPPPGGFDAGGPPPPPGEYYSDDDGSYTDEDYDEDYADLARQMFSTMSPETYARTGWKSVVDGGGVPGLRGYKGPGGDGGSRSGAKGGGGSGLRGGWFGASGGNDERRRDGSPPRAGAGAGARHRSDDELFDHLERMRTEAARYAADAAKREEEAKRAKAPLEKLQRPTLVSRTDTSVTLNLYRGKNQSTLPSDRRWELSLKKERERDYAVFTSVKGKTVVTVSDLDPGTRYCFKARVGRVGSDGDEVTEWGPHSV